MKKLVLALFSVAAFAGVSNFDSITLGDNLVVGGTSTLTGSTTLTGTATAQSLIVDDFFELDPGSTVDTSSSVNATITPIASYQIVDTAGDVAVATANNIATANIANGTILVISSSLASQDIVFIETGNLNLGGTRTLTDPNDKIILIKDGTNSWSEMSFVDNE